MANRCKVLEQMNAAYDDPLRQKVIRIVLQMSDTPTNRLTMLKAHAAIKAIRAGIEGHAVLKREEIIIACLEMPSPQPNVEMTDANRERTKP